MGCGASKEGADVSKASPIVPSIPAADAGKAKPPAAGDSTSGPHAGGKKTVALSPRIGNGGPIPYAPLPGPGMKEIVGEKVGDILINIYYPEDIDRRNDLPLIVYQHGRGTTYHVYQTLFQRWVAMGYIVAFPYNENSAVMGEDPPWPSTALDESLDGVEMQLTIKSMSQRNSDSSSVFKNKVDMKNVALAGHSMGGKSSICAGAQVGPSCLVLHSPSCSSEGSEVYNLSKEWIEDKFRGLSNDKTPILLLTSDEDVRRENVESLFDTPLLADCPRVYLQFSKEACAKVHDTIVDQYAPPRTIFSREFMSQGPVDDNGFQAHCYLGAGGENDPSLHWGDVFMKLYLSNGGDKNCSVWKMIYGDGEGSVQKDPLLSKVKVSLGRA